MNNLFTPQIFTINRLALELGDPTNINVRDDGPAAVTYPNGTTYMISMMGHAREA